MNNKTVHQASLLEFAKQYQAPMTDKYHLGYFHAFYDQLLTPRRETAKSLLEVGVQNGYSIALWRDYFVNAHITGVDVSPCSTLAGCERVTFLQADAYTPYFIQSLANRKYDVIIDDGPHTYESMVFFLNHYPKLLSQGGLLILEDIIDPMWTPSLEQLVPCCRVCHTAGMQLTEELLDRWQNGLDVIVYQKD